MTAEQADILKGYLRQDGWTIEQIHFLRGGNISHDTLTIVTEQKMGTRKYRFVDVIDREGRTTTTRETELTV